MVKKINSPNDRNINNFDFIRFIAALFVIITHSYSLLGNKAGDLLFQVTNGSIMFSHLGVAIFFTISGYLITQSSEHSSSWRSYLWKRIFRLIPGLIVAILICTFVLGPLVTSQSLLGYFKNKETYQFLLSTSLFIQNYSLPGVFDNNPVQSVNGSLWTLAYEFTLYIAVMIGFILGITKKRKLLLILWFLFLGFRIYLGNKYFWYSYSSVYTFNLNMLYLFEWSFYFLSGMLYYLFKDKMQFNSKILFLLIFIYIIFVIFDKKEVVDALNYTIIPYLVFFLSSLKGKLNYFNKFGDPSYGLYIYSFPIQQLVIWFFHNKISIDLLLFISIITALPIAYLSWHFIEKKALKYKNLIQ